MSYALYQVLHILGIALLFLSLGALCFHGLTGGTRDTNPARGLIMGTHGLGVLLLIVAGFGMLHTKYGGAFPGWVHPKLLAWLVLAAAPSILGRSPGAARVFWFVAPLLALLAAYFGLNHS